MVLETECRNDQLSTELINQFNREGCLVLPGYLSATETIEIRSAFMEQTKDGPVEGLSDSRRLLGPGDPLARYPRMMNPHRHLDKRVGPVSLRHMLSARLHGILCALMGDEPLGAQSMFYFKPPGA